MIGMLSPQAHTHGRLWAISNASALTKGQMNINQQNGNNMKTTEKKEKRKYEKPWMQVYDLPEPTRLLQTSATLQDYNVEYEDNW